MSDDIQDALADLRGEVGGIKGRQSMVLLLMSAAGIASLSMIGFVYAHTQEPYHLGSLVEIQKAEHRTTEAIGPEQARMANALEHIQKDIDQIRRKLEQYDRNINEFYRHNPDVIDPLYER